MIDDPDGFYDGLHQVVTPWHVALRNHPVYAMVESDDALRLFMRHHVWAVWDFMALAKRLQQIVSPSHGAYWAPGPYGSAVTRAVLELVLGEEADRIAWPDGTETVGSHVELYLTAMREVGADRHPVENLLGKLAAGREPTAGLIDEVDIPPAARAFVGTTLSIVNDGTPAELAGAFLFGREEVIPAMFDSLLARSPKARAATALRVYLERHVEVDDGSHRHLARSVLVAVCGDDPVAWGDARRGAEQALTARLQLWGDVVLALRS